jgi:hypothetical protein
MYLRIYVFMYSCIYRVLITHCFFFVYLSLIDFFSCTKKNCVLVVYWFLWSRSVAVYLCILCVNTVFMYSLCKYCIMYSLCKYCGYLLAMYLCIHCVKIVYSLCKHFYMHLWSHTLAMYLCIDSVTRVSMYPLCK